MPKMPTTPPTIEPMPMPAATVLEVVILTLTSLFAVWMIGPRHIYRTIAAQSRATREQTAQTEGKESQ